MKVCRVCHQLKPVEEFNVCSAKKDGRSMVCRECTNVLRREYTRLHPGKEAEKKRVYWSEHLELKKECNRRKKKRAKELYPEKVKAEKRAWKARWKERSPDKLLAQKAVRRAVKNGTIEKQPCYMCGSLSSEGHHVDYSKRLEVVWLCQEHHEMVHGRR